MGLPVYEEMATPSIESTKITLNGIIKELGLGSFFEVSIDKDQSIFKLKEEIYEKVQASLPNNIVGGISIKLWSVRVPRNDSKIDQLKEDVNATVEIHIVIQGRLLVYAQN